MSSHVKNQETPAGPSRKRTPRTVVAGLAKMVHKHILFAKRNPEKVAEEAAKMRISTDAMLALVIADSIYEEYLSHSDTN